MRKVSRLFGYRPFLSLIYLRVSISKLFLLFFLFLVELGLLGSQCCIDRRNQLSIFLPRASHFCLVDFEILAYLLILLSEFDLDLVRGEELDLLPLLLQMIS